MLNLRDATSFCVSGRINYPDINSISKTEIVPIDLLAVGNSFEIQILSIYCFPQKVKHRRQLFKVTCNYVQSWDYNEKTGSKYYVPELLSLWNYSESGDDKDSKYEINSQFSQITDAKGDLFLYFDPLFPGPPAPDPPPAQGAQGKAPKLWVDPDNYMDLFVHLRIRKRRKVDMDFLLTE